MAHTRTHARHRRRIRMSIGRTAIYTADIGSGGFSAEMMRALPAGSAVEGTIRVDHVEGDYTGEVVWSLPGDLRLNVRGRIGVRFISLPPDVRRLIESPAFTHLA